LEINKSTPQTQSNVIWISFQAKLEISFLNSLLEKLVWESGPKIVPATGVTIEFLLISDFPTNLIKKQLVQFLPGERLDLKKNWID